MSLALVQDRWSILTARRRTHVPPPVEMLDEPLLLGGTGFVSAIVLRCVTAARIGISRRFTLRVALLSAGDPPGGLHDVPHGLASTSRESAPSSSPGVRHATNKNRNTPNGVCPTVETMLQRPRPLRCPSRIAHERISWSTKSPNMERTVWNEPFVRRIPLRSLVSTMMWRKNHTFHRVDRLPAARHPESSPQAPSRE